MPLVPDQPDISVVMGVYNGAELLSDTIDSVLDQEFSDFEFIIINDGSTDTSVAALLDDYTKRDRRISVIEKQNEGLTLALIDGCKAAVGAYIARIDAGDVMMPQRLLLQKQVLDQYPHCHFVSSRVGFFGPLWESLWLAPGKPEANSPISVVSKKLDQGLDADIPHHASVMFRKSAYLQAGGYRQQFYYGQDWDLWYRLAEISEYFVVPEVLYKARLFPNAISMSHSKRQEAIARCSLAAHIARKRGESEEHILDEAQKIRPGLYPGKRDKKTNGFYFIGEALRRNNNPACRRYLVNGIKAFPFSLSPYIRLIQSFI